jgi:ribosomal protein L32
VLRLHTSKELMLVVTDTHYLKLLEIMNKCKFCGSTELVYNIYVMDSSCQECGEWQEGEEI